MYTTSHGLDSDLIQHIGSENCDLHILFSWIANRDLPLTYFSFRQQFNVLSFDESVSSAGQHSLKCRSDDPDYVSHSDNRKRCG